MKTKSSVIALSFIGLLIFSACSPSGVSLPPSSVPTPTGMEGVETQASTLIPTTSTPLAALNCVRPAQPLSPSVPVKGKIILAALAPFTDPSYLVDLRSGEEVVLPQEENKIIADWSFSVSPNRKWLEYAQVNADRSKAFDETLHIIDADGVERATISENINQRGSVWIADTYLALKMQLDSVWIDYRMIDT